MKISEAWRRRIQLGVAVLMLIGTLMNFYRYFFTNDHNLSQLLIAFCLVEPYSSSNLGILSKQDKILYFYSLSAEALKSKPPQNSKQMK